MVAEKAQLCELLLFPAGQCHLKGRIAGKRCGGAGVSGRASQLGSHGGQKTVVALCRRESVCRLLSRPVLISPLLANQAVGAVNHLLVVGRSFEVLILQSSLQLPEVNFGTGMHTTSWLQVAAAVKQHLKQGLFIFSWKRRQNILSNVGQEVINNIFQALLEYVAVLFCFLQSAHSNTFSCLILCDVTHYIGKFASCIEMTICLRKLRHKCLILRSFKMRQVPCLR